MVVNAGEKLFLLVGLLASLAAPLRGQEVSLAAPSQANSLDGPADGNIDGMDISPEPGEPFTAKVDVTRRGADPRFLATQFFGIVARDSSGRIYFERWRAPQPWPSTSERLPPFDDYYQGSPMYYFVIDPNESTRTTCYVATKTCRIFSLRQAGDLQQESGSKLPASTTESVSLGTRKLNGLDVVGTRETTTIAAGVNGNPKPIVKVKEVWHSPELDLDVFIKKVDPRTGTLTQELKDLSRGDPDPKYFAVPRDFVFDNKSVAATQSSEENEQNYSGDAKPYLDQPLEQLVKLVPDLKKLQPAPDQQLLPMILQKSGLAVDDFVHNAVDVIAREKIAQQRLNAAGGVTASENVQDDYLILNSGNDVREGLVEYRMDAKGNRLDPVGLNKGYPFTSGFALTCLYFSTARQSDSTFRYIGQQTIDNRKTYVVAFAQIPGHAKFSVTMPGRADGVHILAQGIAWLDQETFRIIRMRTDLFDPPPDVALDRETTVVKFSEVRFKDVATPLWLPSDVKVYLNVSAGNRSCECDALHSPRVRYFRNEHHYVDYRRYRVAVKLGAPP
jgi:hypothetical protein